MSDPAKLPKDQDSSEGDWDDFPFDVDLDDFIKDLRDYLFENLHAGKGSITTDVQLVLAMAMLTSDFAAQALALARNAESWGQVAGKIRSRESIGECLAATQTDVGAARLHEYLGQLPFPHFEADPDDPSNVIRISEDGTRTTGRFVDRVFRPKA